MKIPLASRIGIAGLLATALLIPVVSAQNVGIGTSSPQSKLSVNGSTASGGIAVGDASYTSTPGTVAPLNGAIIQGYTGIGNSAPAMRLHVEGDGTQNWDSSAYMVSTASLPTGAATPGFITRVTDNTSLIDGDLFGRIWFQSMPKEGPSLATKATIDAVHRGFAGADAMGALTFRTSSGVNTAEAMRIDYNGNVGIDAASPQGRLHVASGQILVTPEGLGGNLSQGTANQNGVQISSLGFIGIQRVGGANLPLGKPAGAPLGDSYATFRVDGTVMGSITLTGGGVSFNTTSDERLKENILPSAKGLADVMKIQVSDYHYKTSPDRAETGFIAQQLQTVFPDAVTPGGEDPAKDPWTVDYGRITPVLVKAVQDQQKMIAALGTENAELKEQVAGLKAANQKLATMAAEVEALKQAVASLRTQDESTVRTVSTGR